MHSRAIHGRPRRWPLNDRTAYGLVLLAITFVLPAPYRTRAEGVTWPAEQSHVRASAEGFVKTVIKQNGDRVSAGVPLVEVDDPLNRMRVQLLEAQKKQLEAELMAARSRDPVQVAIVSEALATVTGSLDLALSRLEKLTVRSPQAGIFVIPAESDLPGRFVGKGELFGYVIDEEARVSLIGVLDDWVASDRSGLDRPEPSRD